MDKLKIIACPTAEGFAQEICNYLGTELVKTKYKKFSNDNTFVEVLESVRAKDIYVVQTTQPPVNERVMDLLITIDALKRASAGRINVVLPYYIYSRSDKKDQPRIPVTAKLMSQLIEAAGANRVITCDLHNPAIQAYFNINCDRLTAQSLLQNYFREKNLQDMVIVATDAGSSKKAYKYSEYFKCPIALIDKRREGNDDKAIATTVIGNVTGKNAIIFDDEIDTAGSMIQTVEILKKYKAKSIYAGCTHGVLSGKAIERIQNSPIKELVITKAIYLKISKTKAFKRIQNRIVCPNCGESYTLNLYKPPKKEGICDKCGSFLVKRPTDTKEIFKIRYDSFAKYTYPVINYFDNKKKLITVDAMSPNEEIIAIIKNALL